MGPLVSGAMNAVQGKWGAAAGSIIGGIAGSTLGPIGTMFGSALGGALGGGITGEDAQPQIAQAPEANQPVPPPMSRQAPPPSYDQHVDDWQQSVGGFASGFADGGFVIGPTPPPAPDFVIGPTNPNTSTQTQGSNNGGFVIGPTPPAPVPSPAPSPTPSPNTQQPTTGKGVTDTTPSPVAQQPTAGKGVAGTTGGNMPQNGIPGIGAQFGQGPSSMFYRGPYYGELNQAWDPIAAGQAQLLSVGYQPKGFLTPPQGSVPTTGNGATGTTKPTGSATGGTNTGATQPNSNSSNDPNSSGIWMAGRYTPIPPKNPEKEGYTQILQYPETGDSGWMAQWDYVPNDLYEKQMAWQKDNDERMRMMGGGGGD